jgi:hypothetical protein
MIHQAFFESYQKQEVTLNFLQLNEVLYIWQFCRQLQMMQVMVFFVTAAIYANGCFCSLNPSKFIWKNSSVFPTH